MQGQGHTQHVQGSQGQPLAPQTERNVHVPDQNQSPLPAGQGEKLESLPVKEPSTFRRIGNKFGLGREKRSPGLISPLQVTTEQQAPPVPTKSLPEPIDTSGVHDASQAFNTESAPRQSSPAARVTVPGAQGQQAYQGPHAQPTQQRQQRQQEQYEHQHQQGQPQYQPHHTFTQPQNPNNQSNIIHSYSAHYNQQQDQGDQSTLNPTSNAAGYVQDPSGSLTKVSEPRLLQSQTNEESMAIDIARQHKTFFGGLRVPFTRKHAPQPPVASTSPTINHPSNQLSMSLIAASRSMGVDPKITGSSAQQPPGVPQFITRPQNVTASHVSGYDSSIPRKELQLDQRVSSGTPSAGARQGRTGASNGTQKMFQTPTSPGDVVSDHADTTGMQLQVYRLGNSTATPSPAKFDTRTQGQFTRHDMPQQSSMLSPGMRVRNPEHQTNESQAPMVEGFKDATTSSTYFHTAEPITSNAEAAMRHKSLPVPAQPPHQEFSPSQYAPTEDVYTPDDDAEGVWRDTTEQPEAGDLQMVPNFDTTLPADQDQSASMPMDSSYKLHPQKTPLQNESRPRKSGLTGSQTGKDSRMPPPPRVRTPAIPQKDPFQGMESRTEDFLRSQCIYHVDPGHDWLGTLIEWTKRIQRDSHTEQTKTVMDFQKQLNDAQQELQRESQLARHQGLEIRDQKTRISQLETSLQKANEATATYEEAKRSLDEASQKISTLESQNRLHERNISNQTDSIGSHLAHIKSLNAQLETIRSEHDEKMIAAEALWTANLASAQKQHKEDLAKSKGQHADQVNWLKSEHMKKLDATATQYQQRLEKLEQDLNGASTRQAAEAERLNTEHKAELERAAKKHRQELKRLELAQSSAATLHAAEIEKMKTECNASIEAAGQEHTQEVERLEQERSNLISKQREALQAKHRQNEELQRKHQSELGMKNQAIVKLRSQYQAELTTRDEECARLTSGYKEEAAALATEHKRQTAELDKRYQGELRAKDQSIGHLRAKHQEQVATLKSGHQQELAAKDGEMSRLSERHTGQLTALVSTHQKQLSERNREISELAAGHKVDLAALMSRHKEELDAKDRQMAQLGERHERQVQGIISEHREELAAKEYQKSQLIARHKAQLEEMQNHMRDLAFKHDKERQVQDEEKEIIRASVKEEIDKATKKYRATIEQQRQQIAAYSKDTYGYVEIDDTTFARTFQGLIQEVNQLASQVWLPATLDFDDSLDPNNCLGRNHGADQRRWIWPRFVASTCWSILLSGFFALPLGFGALGTHGDGYICMGATHQAAILYGNNDSGEGSLPNDKQTNLYRVLHFNRIISAIRADQGSGSVMLAHMFDTNVRQVSSQLYDTLSHIVNAQLDQSCANLALDISRKVAMLALEMGTQRSQVVLQLCRHEERPSSAEWATEEAGGARSQAVDLMVHPCLSRIGDGREDIEHKKVIVKGGYVPLSAGYR